MELSIYRIKRILEGADHYYKDIKAITKGDSKPTYKLVGDEIIVENTFPTLTKAIKSNVHKVTKVVEETTTEE